MLWCFKCYGCNNNVMLCLPAKKWHCDHILWLPAYPEPLLVDLFWGLYALRSLVLPESWLALESQHAPISSPSLVLFRPCFDLTSTITSSDCCTRLNCDLHYNKEPQKTILLLKFLIPPFITDFINFYPLFINTTAVCSVLLEE